MKRLIASVVLVVALLTSGAVVTQSSLVGTAYADGGGGETDTCLQILAERCKPYWVYTFFVLTVCL